MTDPTPGLHVAIIEALDNVVSCDVWDAVPDNAEYPYVTVDRTDSINQDFLASRMDERFYYLNVWSANYGQAEVLDIMSQIETLHGQSIQVNTGRAFGLQVWRKRTLREPDNLTYQGQVTLRLFTTH